MTLWTLSPEGRQASMPASTAAALLVHDLKNALGALEGTLEALQAAPEPDRDGARRAWRQCVALRQRLIGLLVLERGDLEARCAVQDESPAALIERLCAEAADDDGPAGVVVCADPQALPPPVWYYDARLLRLALDAALHNARRHARHRVWIGARQVDGGLCWQVRDDGPGLAGGLPSAGATGLGLRLCAAVAQAHADGPRHGRAQLSDHPEGGAVFELWLP